MNRKLTPLQVQQIRNLLSQKVKQKVIARSFGIQQSTVSYIARSLTWNKSN